MQAQALYGMVWKIHRPQADSCAWAIQQASYLGMCNRANGFLPVSLSRNSNCQEIRHLRVASPFDVLCSLILARRLWIAVSAAALTAHGKAAQSLNSTRTKVLVAIMQDKMRYSKLLYMSLRCRSHTCS